MARLRGWMIVGGLVTAFVAGGLATYLLTAGDDSDSHRSPSGLPLDQECLDLWNANPKVRNAAGMEAIVGRQLHSPKCLITLFGDRVVVQYVEAGGTYTFSGSSPTAGTPAAIKD